MAQAGFAYDEKVELAQPEGRCVPLSVSIFADRAQLRAALAEDLAAAGFRTARGGDLAVLFGSEPIALGDVVLVDCPQVDEAALQALGRLDRRAAHCDAELIVATGIEALDEVYACLERSRSQVLIAPQRAEIVVALGRVLARGSATRLREMSEEDRLQILRLTEQVESLARQLSSLAGEGGAGARPSPLLRQDDAQYAAEEAPANPPKGMSRSIRPALPDPRLVRRIIRQRQLRGRYFDPDLFADPAWDILLDLAAARAEHMRVSVSSLCIAASVPPTTALRWIGQMVEEGLLERQEDVTDRRRAFIALSDSAADAMARYFAELGPAAASLA